MLVVATDTVRALAWSLRREAETSLRPRLANHHEVLVQPRDLSSPADCQVHVVDANCGEVLALVQRRAFFRGLEIDGSVLVVRF